MTQQNATLIGSIAIILWSFLALSTSHSAIVPPLLLLSLTFGIASLLFFLVYLCKGTLKTAWQQTPISVMLLGGCAFFLYHFFYFYAFQNAPPVEAGLIAYLWPLLIVIFSAFSKGQSLSWGHFFGGMLAFTGTIIMLQSNTSLDDSNSDNHWTGYVSAFACAFIWSSYSVYNRRFQSIPSSAVLWYCLITTFSAGICHALLEVHPTSLPLSTWFAIISLGLGPVGIAFFCWDMGVKKGNLSLLGVLSYTAPALSTVWLGLFTDAQLNQGQVIACVLITVSALTTSLLSKKPPQT